MGPCCRQGTLEGTHDVLLQKRAAANDVLLLAFPAPLLSPQEQQILETAGNDVVQQGLQARQCYLRMVSLLCYSAGDVDVAAAAHMTKLVGGQRPLWCSSCMLAGVTEWQLKLSFALLSWRAPSVSLNLIALSNALSQTETLPLSPSLSEEGQAHLAARPCADGPDQARPRVPRRPCHPSRAGPRARPLPQPHGAPHRCSVCPSTAQL